MPNIKLTLEYDGTEFFGSQKQARHRTVQSELETALRKLFQKTPQVIFAGRTDSGVHAEGQVVNFHTESKIQLGKIRLALNAYLPEDLAVTEIEEVPDSFHAQFDAKWKTYEYRILHSKARSPLNRKQTFQHVGSLDIKQMIRASHYFCGRHNFKVFEAEGSRRKTTIRTIRKFQVRKSGNIITLAVESDGFLYKMVRSLAGTLLAVGAGKIKAQEMSAILKSQDRKRIGQTLPGYGLTLKKIIY